MQNQPVMRMEHVRLRHDRSSSRSTSSGVLPGAAECGWRRGKYGCRPRSWARRRRCSSPHWRSCGRRPAASSASRARGTSPPKSSISCPRQRDHMLRLGAVKPDRLDHLAQFFLAERQHFLRRIGDGEERAVALLTPASVACADSTTATSRVKGFTYSSSPLGTGSASAKRRKISSIRAASAFSPVSPRFGAAGFRHGRLLSSPRRCDDLP